MRFDDRFWRKQGPERFDLPSSLATCPSSLIPMPRKSILVVDDEKNQREILETILSGEGYDVTTASSGEAAMKFVADRHFDLVLTDLKMTGMSGLDLLKQLTDFDKSIIVILLTAHGTIDSAVRSDEKNQREILETILSGEGYDVTTASSGEAAMKFVADRHFDLVLTDLKMTGMSGLDLLKQLTDFDKSIIVILLTAHGTIDSAVDAL